MSDLERILLMGIDLWAICILSIYINRTGLCRQTIPAMIVLGLAALSFCAFMHGMRK